MVLFKRKKEIVVKEVSGGKYEESPSAQEMLRRERVARGKRFVAGFQKFGQRAVGGIRQARVGSLVYAKRIKAPIPLSTRGTGYYQGEKFVRVKYGRGRPKGSYDPRYAQFGGVYGFRKYLTAQRMQQRFQQQQFPQQQLAPQLQLSPQQQMAIAQAQAEQKKQQFLSNNIGWDAHFIAPELERETSKKGAMSLQDEIDSTIRDLPQ